MNIRNFLELDYLLLLAALGLTVLGILFIYSSGVTSEGIIISTEYRRQIIWAAAALISALVIAMLNYRRIYEISLYLYLATLLLLLYTFVFGRVVQGGGRWLRIGSFSLQVSEFAKIATILFLAWYLDYSRRNQKAFFRFMISCFIVLLPMGLILIQPDLGTALVFIPILLGMTFMAGISLRYIVFFGFSIVLAGIFLVMPFWQTTIMNNTIPVVMILVNRNFMALSILIFSFIALISWIGYARYHKEYFNWICYGAGIFIFSLGASYAARKILREYQMMRLVVFLDPNVDPRGAGWHIIQSVTAIGSGGMFGKGFLQGTQSQYRFLPEQSTDFIFAILSEEWGFMGGTLVFLLFLVMNLRLIRIMRITTDTFGSFIVAGLVSMYAFHFLVNVGMTMGIMPITGIPLTFVSYGGSSLFSAMIGIGLSMSVHMRRYQH